MLYGSHRGFDIYFTVYVTNQAFGRAPHIPDIYGFQGVVVKTGLPENDVSGVRFNSEPQEGYRQPDIANAVAEQVGTELANRLADAGTLQL